MSRARFTRRELDAGIEAMLASRLETFGSLTGEDALAVFAMIVHDGLATSAECAAWLQAVERYGTDHTEFHAVTIALAKELLAQTEDPSGGPAPPPAPSAPPPRDDLDPRLIGRWDYTRYYNTGTFSSTISRVMILAADGKFIEDGASSATLRSVDATGRHTGTTSAYSGAAPDERGTWSAKNGVLRLDYDNQTYSEYRYEASGPSGERRLLTRSKSGKQQFWVEF
jgi:hypothetical protein